MLNRLLIAAMLAGAMGFACGQHADRDIVAPVAIHDGTWNEDDGSVSGTLVVEDGSLVVVAAGRRILPAFPDDGIVWDPRRQVLSVKGMEFRAGSGVGLGGSYARHKQLPAGTSVGQGASRQLPIRLPLACPGAAVATTPRTPGT